MRRRTAHRGPRAARETKKEGPPPPRPLHFASYAVDARRSPLSAQGKAKGDDDASPEALAKKRVADAEALIPAIEQALESVKTKNVDDYKLRFILAQAHHDCGRDEEAAQALASS